MRSLPASDGQALSHTAVASRERTGAVSPDRAAQSSGELRLARAELPLRRQALTALSQSGHLRAARGRGGGTFVADPLPSPARAQQSLGDWRSTCDWRAAVEVGVAALAARRAAGRAVEELHALADAMDGLLEDFDTYRQADAQLHIGIAVAAGSAGLVAATTEVQGAMDDLIARIAHPPEVLSSSNGQHRQIIDAIDRGDEHTAMAAMLEHLRATEHILAGLLPGPEPDAA